MTERRGPLVFGDRVTITGGFWRGRSGVYLRDEETILGEAPIVKLDNGVSCAVVLPDRMEREE